MSFRPIALAIALALLILAPAAARAHEVLHTIERGRAIAVRAYFADGGELAYREYQVFAPAAPAVPHQEGWTDRKGWLAFVPDSPGTWRVKVSDGSGHGVELAVDATAAPEARDGGALPAVAFVLRPVAGILAIGAVFAALFALYRRKAPR